MANDDMVLVAAEAILQAHAHDLTTPRPGECLLCFIHRELDEFGCDTTLRFARRYRDLEAPRATALERRLGQVGGFCDCEIFLNGYTLADEFWTRQREIEREGFVELVPREPPDDPPACRTVPRGSSRPCSVWERLRHDRW